VPRAARTAGRIDGSGTSAAELLRDARSRNGSPRTRSSRSREGRTRSSRPACAALAPARSCQNEPRKRLQARSMGWRARSSGDGDRGQRPATTSCSQNRVSADAVGAAAAAGFDDLLPRAPAPTIVVSSRPSRSGALPEPRPAQPRRIDPGGEVGEEVVVKEGGARSRSLEDGSRERQSRLRRGSDHRGAILSRRPTIGSRRRARRRMPI